MPHKDPAVAKKYFAKRSGARYRQAAAANVCVVCLNKSAIVGGKRCVECACKHVKAATVRRIRLQHQGRCVRCMASARPGRNTCAKCSADQIMQNRIKRELRKDIVFGKYGGAFCACCGEKERAFLSIDHVNNDGKAHRKVVACGSLLAWLIRHKFPSGFQVLCMNCNFAKGLKNSDGLCPHERARRLLNRVA